MLTHHHFHFLAVGRHDPGFIEEGVSHYSRQCRKFCHIKWQIVKESRQVRPQVRVAEEGRALGRALGKISRPFAIALVPSPKARSSEVLARDLAGWMQVSSHLCFIIGGPYGLDKGLASSAHARWSLSPLTMNHGLVRLVLLEQVYRALAIHFNVPYHY